ncbi:SWI/SNF-related matrix-associated actin-dependent regulator of chromatin subfamily B member 1-A [Gracilariopsis chorda]|uniref:SWI/SNF-related matrix-associated actin-dependent regulator of chromatin subfamily B member 1-A n=1 Tax=Gracilariopsis chorda TaxID=448386 RepID=A0A2V3IYU1_9FLOR|nr:SWI/SNF-related matrix-associated actin-dependent regulator of chromatin subfamily B member 1-A [Gracilariopsis chorda]|eukprot:PXF47322.1 SWI/SNF-related matrix-associated actin-dependent regulator of chromatin subfamily B member 1-A [Gracilariopsis chorda]
MRGPTVNAPSEEALREMMRAAAATASAAAGDATVAAAAVTTSEATRYVRHSTGRSSANRRQSISMLPPTLGGEQFRQGAPLQPVEGGVRWQKIQAVAREIAAKWTHPPGSSQYETDTLHHVRAILYMNKSLITQSFVSHVSGVSQGSLSHYVRGLFRGNQKNVDDRLAVFVEKFAEGQYDKFLEEARSGTRPIGRPAFYDSLNLATVAAHRSNQGSLPPPNAPPVTDSRPPIPPPPPPQLQPPPWRPPPPPALPPKLTTSPTSRSPAKSGLSDGEKGTDEEKPNGLEKSNDQEQTSAGRNKKLEEKRLSERARRAQQRAQKQRSGKRPRPVFPPIPEETKEPTSVLAVEKAYHALAAPKWTGEFSNAEPLLIPIELFVTVGSRTLHTYAQWDVNERQLSPEKVADHIRRARGLPEDFVKPVAHQIRRSLYDAGVVCPPPPDLPEAENRRLIKIVVELKDGDTVNVLRDEFEWDLGAGSLNSPELFAQLLCTDANIPQKHAAAVARTLRAQLVRAHAIAYGDEETRKLAENGMAADDTLRVKLPSVGSSMVKCTVEDIRVKDREENELAIRNVFVKPLLDNIPDEAERRKEERVQKAAEEKLRRELEAIRRVELAELAKRNAEVEQARKQVEEEATKVYQTRNLDFRPYLKLRVARGESPSLWMPAAFDRRRRKQLTFPMTQPSRKTTGHSFTFSRISKRRRSGVRKDPEDRSTGRSQPKTEGHPVKKQKTEPMPVAGKSISPEEYKRVMIRIRLKDPVTQNKAPAPKKRR